MDQAAVLGVGTVALTGGEPTVRKDVVLSLLQRARERAPTMMLRMVSNGSFLDLPYLTALKHGGLDVLQLSLHFEAVNRGKVLSQKVIDAALEEYARKVDLARDAGLFVVGNLVCVRSYIPYVIHSLSRVLETTDVNYVCLEWPFAQGLILEHPELDPAHAVKAIEPGLRALEAKFGNRMNVNPRGPYPGMNVDYDRGIPTGMVIAPNGEVSQYHSTIEWGPRYKLGDVRVQTLQSIWQDALAAYHASHPLPVASAG